MRLYNRKDFINLPDMTIYSRMPYGKVVGLCEGLYCKTESFDNDFVEQDLISEAGYPDEMEEGLEALMYQINLRDYYKDFRTDLDCSGRDGLFDEDDKFIVWDR